MPLGGVGQPRHPFNNRMISYIHSALQDKPVVFVINKLTSHESNDGCNYRYTHSVVKDVIGAYNSVNLLILDCTSWMDSGFEIELFRVGVSSTTSRGITVGKCGRDKVWELISKEAFDNFIGLMESDDIEEQNDSDGDEE